MDPVTIFTVCTTASSVAKAVYKAGIALRNFIQGVQTINETADGLYQEVSALHTTVRAVESTLSTPAVRNAAPPGLWNKVEDCLQNCQTTMTIFGAKIDSIKFDPKNNLAKNALRVWKMTLEEDDIATLRSQIHAHNGAMQLMLVTINW
jgi:hypothetical protein